MKKFFLLGMFIIFLSSFTMLAQAQNENLTITTYYPAPVGVYNNLRLFPTTTVPACNSNAEGTMYYNNTTNVIMLCQETSASVFGWQNIGGGLWGQTGNNIYPNNNAWNVGIGTMTPAAKLHVAGEIVSNGANGGNMLNLSFAGSGTQTILRDDGDQLHLLPWGRNLATGQNQVCIGCGRYGNADVNLFVVGRIQSRRLVIEKRNSTPPSVQEGEIWIVN